MSRLSAANLTVRRDGRAILDDASFDLEPGMFVALIGANGAGKSTLLSVLAGLLQPDEGQVFVDGAAMASLERRALARRRAYLPQSLRAEWPISVERLVALGLTPHLPAFGGLPGGMEPRLTDAIEACDLTDHRLQAATTLSGGELARAMLARALIGDPEILIADEPMSGLDPRHALDTAARLQKLAQAGKLVIASVHDLTMAARYCSHIMALHEGKLVAFGPAADVLTPDLLRHTFGVEACIVGAGPGVFIDFLKPASDNLTAEPGSDDHPT